MNYEQFAVWLHGFLEISNADEINKEQTQIIKDHLVLLFEKKTPDRSKKKEEGKSISLEHLCQEIPVGEQFVGVDMKFDAEAHKTKTYC